MIRMNPLASLIGNYGDSDEESDSEIGIQRTIIGRSKVASATSSDPIHPSPIAHCPWSACYDETSGFTYYWNQHTNAVTWDAPQEYLLALKLAQQQLHSQGSSEVSVEEWQLYQQALAEKQQNKVLSKGNIVKPPKNNEKAPVNNDKNKNNKKRKLNDIQEEKIELITSYHNSDSESNDESESPLKALPSKSSEIKPPTPKIPKTVIKKVKTKPVTVPYGPTLPPSQNYTVPIGPELPEDRINEKPKSLENKADKPDEINKSKHEVKKSKSSDNEDSNDESLLLMKLKDKAKILENLGGELPSGLQKIIEEETKALSGLSKAKENKPSEDSIDDLLHEIEKKELPKIRTKNVDKDGVDYKLNDSAKNSPRSRDMTPPLELNPLFPSAKNISMDLTEKIEMNSTDNDKVDISVNVVEKKGINLYLMDDSEVIENVSRKKLRISNSVLPDRKKNDTPSYTTKYSEHIEGFSNERTGLGFSKDDESEKSGKNTIVYGNGLTFTKGETLNEENKDEDLDNLTELVEAKLKYLNQLQPCHVTPVQEMLIQMQTLVSAFRSGALSSAYWRRWTEAASHSLTHHETSASPPGWTCVFQRSEGRYQYRRDSDGLVQWEYPAVANTDMDICTTPPHPGLEGKDEVHPYPMTLPLHPPPPPGPPAPSVSHSSDSPGGRVQTPPPPGWGVDPPPPGVDDLPTLPNEQNREIGDELTSFYNDIAELEKHTSEPHTASNSPSTSPTHHDDIIDKDKIRDKDKEYKTNKKKSKVKISSSIGLKHKSVSTLVAKWQQVADEISSD